ncbi:hypothetical protein GTZ99_07125 [Novosphingobium sp. FSY-8]|uniref:Superfamily III holin-X n=1 Tax=Novosphingobium ovatum TaxID=1908523 RepID=A0ABW9XCR5_9SPHN|nr:phage holin family protein [Novosphingobium ovatum]NBC36328.1 hypothetical protein [Novosphingobium ovatum]
MPKRRDTRPHDAAQADQAADGQAAADTSHAARRGWRRFFRPATGADGAHAHRWLSDDVSSFYHSARDAWDSEIAFQKARARLAARLTARIAALGCLALTGLFFVAMALVVGAVLGLAQCVGPWWATAIVAGALALITLMAVGAARSQWRRLRHALFGTEG